ncbi:hypothetical protein BH24ACT3_BH24ACT3_12240 [soil metagenome]
MASANPASTPNPNAMKFTLDVTVPQMINVTNPDDATDPLTCALFAIDGVVGVFATADFVTVSKAPGADWDVITSSVVQVIAEKL